MRTILPKLKETVMEGPALSLHLRKKADESNGPLVLVTTDNNAAYKLKNELEHFALEVHYPVLMFPDRETLPYDFFSPHQDLISDRLLVLDKLTKLKKGIVIIAIQTLMYRLSPPDYLHAHCFSLHVGDTLDLTKLKSQLIQSGYYCLSEVRNHGEFAFRGSIIDIFAMGAHQPLRIDLLDDMIDSLSYFNALTQRSEKTVSSIQILPAKEFPLDLNTLSLFKQKWAHLSWQPNPLYQEVMQKKMPAGIEYYLPLFFEKLSSFIDYLPSNSVLAFIGDIQSSAEQFWRSIVHRYEQYRHDAQQPIMPPAELFIPINDLFGQCKSYPQYHISLTREPERLINITDNIEPLLALIQSSTTHILLCAESLGRREALISLFAKHQLTPHRYENFLEVINNPNHLGILIAPIDQGGSLPAYSLLILSESELYGKRVMQRRQREQKSVLDYNFKSLAELTPGAPVVHLDYGVGRYRGLTHLSINQSEALSEFLCIEYANQDKIYLPISSLELISPYLGSDPDHAPLNKLGADQWDKAKKKAIAKAKDVAAELLEIYARRAAKTGFAYKAPDESYQQFKDQFLFEETPDQEKAIENVLNDMQATTPMDRLICGDVGFGKTEVALRGAFLAVQNNKQVAVLVPTTLLAQQHFETFSERFASWPIKVEVLSRFKSVRESKQISEQVKAGQIDVLIGTHKIIQSTLEFKQLGLLIIDEEHRFGVSQKEKFKALRSEIDILTLTATPIPRTLNMAMNAIRDLSIISTPPKKRLSIKTFLREYKNDLIQEAIERERMRGGQVYYLHNNVQTIGATTEKLRALMPGVRIEFAHGQMSERLLEQIMSDFYHQRFSVLVCTTIIETGIDVPSANTIIIEKAHQFGLAQLHQLRGRVGRSHHQAYAYCLTPPLSTLKPDALKRLQALESLEELGSGFNLATHDLEIRGAGELLGDEQSGNIQHIGFNLYNDILAQAIQSLQSGKNLDVSAASIEINFHVPALIPDDYINDICVRLRFYQQINHAINDNQLNEIKSELIDRFGLLPTALKQLFIIASVKLIAKPLGIQKIDIQEKQGRMVFADNPNINFAKLMHLIQTEPNTYKLSKSNNKDQLHFVVNTENTDEKVIKLEQLLHAIG